MSDLKEKRVELILQQLQQLPTLPSVAVKVMEITGRDDSTVTQVVEPPSLQTLSYEPGRGTAQAQVQHGEVKERRRENGDDAKHFGAQMP